MNEEAVICDFAEYYHVLDYKALPLRLAATLLCGLGSNSRTVKMVVGLKDADTNILLASITDAINGLIYGLAGGKNKPPSLVAVLTGEKEEETQEEKAITFASGEEYERARREMVERIENAG